MDRPARYPKIFVIATQTLEDDLAVDLAVLEPLADTRRKHLVYLRHVAKQKILAALGHQDEDEYLFETIGSLARSSQLSDKLHDGGTLTAAESAERTELRNAQTTIRQIRQAARTIRQNMSGMTAAQLYAHDIDNDPAWP